MSIDNDEDGPTEATPRRLNLWDVAGITIYTFGACMNEVDNGCRVLANMFASQATYVRLRLERDEEEWARETARAEMAGTLEGLVLFDAEDQA